MKESLAQQCLDLLKQDGIQAEIKVLCQPIFEVAFAAFSPYLYLVLAVVACILLLLIVVIFLLVWILRSQKLLPTFSFFPRIA